MKLLQVMGYVADPRSATRYSISFDAINYVEEFRLKHDKIVCVLGVHGMEHSLFVHDKSYDEVVALLGAL